MQPVTNQGSWCWTWLGKKGCSGEKREQPKSCDNNVLSTSGLQTKPNPPKTSLKEQSFRKNSISLPVVREGWRFSKACTTCRTNVLPQVQPASVGRSSTLVTEGAGCRWWQGANHITGVTQAVFIAILRVLWHFHPFMQPSQCSVVMQSFSLTILCQKKHLADLTKL